MTDAIPQRQFDEMSRAFGSIEAQVKAFEKYVHDWRHDESNEQQVFQSTMIREMEALRRDLQADRIRDREDAAAIRLADRVEIDGIKRDLESLKVAHQRREGIMGAADWLIKSPVVGWLVAAGTAIWAYATGRFHP